MTKAEESRFCCGQRLATSFCEVCGRKTCSDCEVILNNKTFCRSCSKAATVNQFVLTHRNPFVAAVLAALVPGTGQIYNGQIGKGVLVFFSCWLIIPWIYGIADAFLTARKMDRSEMEFHPPSGYIVVSLLSLLMLMAGPWMMLKSLRTVHGLKTYVFAVHTVKQKLLGIAQATERYAADHGSYPVGVSQLYFAEPPYLQDLSCDTVQNGYSYTCIFTAEGYSLTAAPSEKSGTDLPTFIATTGGHFSVNKPGPPNKGESDD